MLTLHPSTGRLLLFCQIYIRQDFRWFTSILHGLWLAKNKIKQWQSIEFFKILFSPLHSILTFELIFKNLSVEPFSFRLAKLFPACILYRKYWYIHVIISYFWSKFIIEQNFWTLRRIVSVLVVQVYLWKASPTLWRCPLDKATFPV